MGPRLGPKADQVQFLRCMQGPRQGRTLKYLINEYRIKIPKMLNEYDLINGYEGKFHDYSK